MERLQTLAQRSGVQCLAWLLHLRGSRAVHAQSTNRPGIRFIPADELSYKTSAIGQWGLGNTGSN